MIRDKLPDSFLPDEQDLILHAFHKSRNSAGAESLKQPSNLDVSGEDSLVNLESIEHTESKSFINVTDFAGNDF